MFRKFIVAALLLFISGVANSQMFSFRDSSVVFKDSTGKVLIPEEAQKLMQTKFSMQRKRLPDGKTEITILPESLDSKKNREIQMKWMGSVLVGTKFPDISFPTSISNQKISKQAVRSLSSDEITVVNFWFTACSPCKAEMPDLNQLAEKYKGKHVRFLAITFDDVDTVTGFLKNQVFQFRIIPNAADFIKSFQISVFPTNLVIDKNGVIKYAKIGSAPELKDELQKQIETLLK